MSSALDNLALAGIEVTSVLNRFGGNESLLFRLLKKYLDDKSYPSLIENYEKNDLEATNASAHALKGVSANLGLSSVADIASEIHEDLKKGDSSKLDDNVVKLKEAYGKVVEVIRANC